MAHQKTVKTRRATLVRYDEAIFYTETFGLEVSKDKRVYVHCLCGKKFDFRDNTHPKARDIADCPKCLDEYHFEEREQTYLLIRPITNAQVHVFKTEYELPKAN